MSNNTKDLSQFGQRELLMAEELLQAYADNQADWLDNGVTIEFNTHSGMVFLVDEDNNVAVLEDDKLVQWFFCYECGEEGTAKDFNSGDISDHKVVDGQVEHKESK